MKCIIFFIVYIMQKKMILGRHTRRRPVTKWRLGPRDARPAAMFRRPTMVPAGRSTRSALQKIKFTGSWQDRLLRRRAPKPRDFGGILHDGVAQMAEPASPKAWLLEPEEESLRKINDIGARSGSSDPRVYL